MKTLTLADTRDLFSYLFSLLHYNVNGKKKHKFKVKDSEIEATPLCLGNISKGWTVDNMKKTGLNRYVFDFSVGVLVMMLCS